MIRVGIVGATGYAGAELVRLLAGHPNVELAILTSRQYAGVEFSDIYPSMKTVVDIVCETFSPDVTYERSDIVFTALPHKLPMEIVPGLIDRGKKVIDLSADFRFKEVSTYESFYQPHTAQKLLESAVYGLCEVYSERIRTAQLVGNPGCYPTSIILPLLPLLKNDLLLSRSIIADSKSGVSGAGRVPSLTTHFCEVNESFKAYKVTDHRHNPEMDEVLGLETGKNIHITFVPHLVPISRGMLSTIYAELSEKVGAEDIENCLRSFYKECPFVRIVDAGKLPDTLHVRGSNFCDIGFRVDESHHRLVIVSAIDNLVKGAAGQAVQNMNIMLGLGETAGLTNVSLPL